MESSVLDLFQDYQEYAILISLSLNILIAISGLIPSFFLTAANIVFFGFWKGMVISFAGEAVGAAVTFILYRLGFKKISKKALNNHPKLKSIIEVEGIKAFFMVISLRIIPFIPSGVVTMAAAIGKISFLHFAVSSSIGKIPALLIEGFSVYHVITFSWVGKVILLIIGLLLLYWVIHRSF